MPFKKMRFYLALSLIINLLSAESAFGQVFPGDADNNGIVNNLDVLNIGYALGTYGPSRLETGAQPGIETFTVLWSDYFPQGLNFAFSDADGNGWVNYLDIATVSANYGLENPNGSETVNFYPGIPGVHAPLYLDKSEVPDFPTEGSYFEIPVYLGTEDIPLESFQGIAFTIEYDPEFIAAIYFVAEEDSWITGGVGCFDFQAPESELGIKEIALSRKGMSAVEGQGKIGTLSLIVIDDLGTLLASPTDSSNVIVNIRNIKSVNADFWSVPIVSDSVNLMIYGPEALPVGLNEPLEESIKLFPNPARNYFYIESGIPLTRLELFNTLGESVLARRIEESYFYEIKNLEKWSPGIYFLRIHTEQGTLTKKVIIKRE